MKAEKIRSLTDDELKHQERDLADQLFKLKFQMNMGQTESLKKIRGLRRDIARVQTIRREQELGAPKATASKTEAPKLTAPKTVKPKKAAHKASTHKASAGKASSTTKTATGKASHKTEKK
jgi:large subunit ribosomal protein L29